LASQFCQGKLVAVLEGGYNLRILGKLACAVTAKLAEIPYVIEEKPQGTIPKIRRKGEKMINQIKKTQSTFWKIE
jgi:acetoin utilization deacetylase AcuC-like enzyme